ncbi:MAG: phosphohistidine phosphatase SixA [Melioribacteraceae bacterium]|nr:MAG: phosphohistidine phosphatase SixA [Melioribacteraceae bacterium]
MKKLYLVRHGKSSWKYRELSDFERPLNDRGRRDVPFMAQLLAKQNIKPDIIVSSPALRAYFTARTFAMILDYPLEKIVSSELIYEAGLNELIAMLSKIDNSCQSVMLTGHNPGLTVLNNTLSEQYIDNIPTSGIVALDLEIAGWNDLKADCAKTEFFEFPKKYF